jgi:hypothetical protein
MSLVINKDTHSIAAACLPPGFCLLPPTITFGYWLIINDLIQVSTLDGKTCVTTTNRYCTHDEYVQTYAPIKGARASKTNFIEIERI